MRYNNMIYNGITIPLVEKDVITILATEQLSEIARANLTLVANLFKNTYSTIPTLNNLDMREMQIKMGSYVIRNINSISLMHELILALEEKDYDKFVIGRIGD